MKRVALQIVDLGFGDSGKGTTVDYLAWKNDAGLVVRFNGGPQAGHNVVLPDSRRHTFAQFSSGSFHAGSRTLLSRFMLIEPYAMLNEADHLRTLGVTDILARTHIDERCLVITPPQQIANRLRERSRRSGAHGTCGMGIGECVEDAITHPEIAVRASDLHDGPKLQRKLRASLELKQKEMRDHLEFATVEERGLFEETSWISNALQVSAAVAEQSQIITPYRASELIRESPFTIFEGAQGVLLDERFGFHPHTTWSKTTFSNADALLDDAGSDIDRQRIGVMRTYLTRHGNGPMVTEDRSLDSIPERDNRDDSSQGRFRRGVLDLVMLRYAVQACEGIDAVAITHLDCLPQMPSIACEGYTVNDHCFYPAPADDLDGMERLTNQLKCATPQYKAFPTTSECDFVDAVESELSIPVRFRSSGETRDAKRGI